MLADPTVTNSLYRNWIQVVPPLATLPTNDYEVCPNQNLQVFHHSRPAMRRFESGNEFASRQWTLTKAIKDLPPRVVGESLPDPLGLGDIISL